MRLLWTRLTISSKPSNLELLLMTKSQNYARYFAQLPFLIEFETRGPFTDDLSVRKLSLSGEKTKCWKWKPNVMFGLMREKKGLWKGLRATNTISTWKYITPVMKKIKTSYEDIHYATLIQYVSDLMAISLISSVQFGNVFYLYQKPHLRRYVSQSSPRFSQSARYHLQVCYTYYDFYVTQRLTVRANKFRQS